MTLDRYEMFETIIIHKTYVGQVLQIICGAKFIWSLMQPLPYESGHEKTCLREFPTRPDTKRDAQSDLRIFC